LGVLGLAFLASTGCSLCCSPYNDDYVTFGSRIPRLDRKHGRVGSILSDPQSIGSDAAVHSGTETRELSYGEEADGVIENGVIENGVISLGTKND